MALSQARQALNNLPHAPLSAETVARLDMLLPQFEMEMQQRANALVLQTRATKAIGPLRRKLRTIIIHFVRVFNMGVKREIFTANDRSHYGLPVVRATMPRLRTDADLMNWAGKIVSGEAVRVAAGGTPMAMPSAAEVAQAYDELRPVKGQLSGLRDSYHHEQQDVDKLRKEVNELIADIWDEVLFHFRKDTPPSMRRKARLYGVIYRPSSKTEVLEEEEDGSTGPEA
jgi:hypothetical protein